MLLIGCHINTWLAFDKQRNWDGNVVISEPRRSFGMKDSSRNVSLIFRLLIANELGSVHGGSDNRVHIG